MIPSPRVVLLSDGAKDQIASADVAERKRHPSVPRRTELGFKHKWIIFQN